jgi:hypothetical protein
MSDQQTNPQAEPVEPQAQPVEGDSATAENPQGEEPAA